jgi:hypothetical protein
MTNLNIPENFDKTSPYIETDLKQGRLLLEGKSYMENPEKLYGQILEWLDNYFADARTKLDVDIKISYFNSSSSKNLFKLLKYIREKREQDFDIEVNWHFHEEDIELEEEVEDIVLAAKTHINMVKSYE